MATEIAATYAVEPKDADGCFALGMNYSIGAGDPVDLIEAHKWFNIAAMRGHADAARIAGTCVGACGWLLSQSRAARWARPISASAICSAISRRSRAASACPRMAAMLNHLCASIRSTGSPAPIE